MPVFAIRDFEPCLRMMITAYDRYARESVFTYQQSTVTVSFTAEAFTKVFGITSEGKKVDKNATKMSTENRQKLLQLVCRDDLTAEEWEQLNARAKEVLHCARRIATSAPCDEE